MSNFASTVRKYTDEISEQTKGVFSSVLCSLLFALIPAYVQLQPTLTASPVEGGEAHWLAVQRIIWSSMLFFVLLSVTNRVHLFRQALSQWRMWPKYSLSALLVAPQYWLFVWAPSNGQTLSLALGYFTMPIVMVLVGRYFYKETLSPYQKLACYFALSGTLYAYALSDGISWIVLCVALGYPVYFIHRKTMSLSTDIGLAMDHLFLMPLAMIGLFYLYPADYFFTLPKSTYLYYIGLGIVAVTPMLLYLYAYSKLKVSVFGLLGYVEPMFIFIVGLMIGDTISSQEVPTYLFIILSLIALLLDSLKRLR